VVQQGHDRQVPAELALELGDQSQRHEGLAADLEKTVRHPDGPEAEEILPEMYQA